MLSMIARTAHAPLNALAFVGRHGTICIAASLLIGIALPVLAAQFRPFLEEAILALLTLAFLKIGFRALGDELRAPETILLSAAIAMFVLPAAVFVALALSGVSQSYPGLYLALFIALAVPPITAVPIFSSLLGLPGPIALAFLLVCMAAAPFAAAIHGELFFNSLLGSIDSVGIGLRLLGFLAAAAGIAFVVQRLVGEARLARAKSHLDGVNVLAMFVFAVAIMDGFGVALVAKPLFIFALLVATFGLAIGQMAIMRAVLHKIDPEKATSIALASGLRNMGLLVASIGIELPETTWLWFVVGQFPIFFMPWIIELFRRNRLVNKQRDV
ncbi:MAG: sodium:proton symporter [Pseudomonadota bacterium]